MPQTREHIVLARQVGVEHLVVFIYKCDLVDDPDSRRCIEQLLDVLDAAIPDPVRAVDKPFLMPIEVVHHIEGRGTVVTGKIAQGGGPSRRQASGCRAGQDAQHRVHRSRDVPQSSRCRQRGAE